jgi:hypothetical protein
MKWVPDKTGRFGQRPHYQPEELDIDCEQVIAAFLMKKYGRIAFPIKTEDLTILIEQKARLDSYADLSGEGEGVEGVTEFVPGKRPLVKIATALNAANMENRLRTTLTHEFGHVHFHEFMFAVETRPRSLFDQEDLPARTNKCKRDNMLSAPEVDWMEWQAGYACGALLMPAGPLIETARRFRADNGVGYTDIVVESDFGRQLIGSVVAAFQVSRDAARVRLLKKRILTNGSATGSSGLF